MNLSYNPATVIDNQKVKLNNYTNIKQSTREELIKKLEAMKDYHCDICEGKVGH